MKHNFTISAFQVNLIALPISIITVYLFLSVYRIIWHELSVEMILHSPFMKLGIFLPVFVFLALLHEIIHWAAFRILGHVEKQNCKIGFQWKTITPYVHCSVPLPAKIYRISLLLPGLLLGIIPTVIAMTFGISWLLIYGIIFTIVSIGDIIILWLLRKVEKTMLVLDNPTKCGCEVIQH
jgi:hypothetical protein